MNNFTKESIKAAAIAKILYPKDELGVAIKKVTKGELNPEQTTITIDQCPEELIYIPNSFTPDGDEFNNIFTPVFTNGFDPANFQMDIYNRWGELIFQSFNAEKGWDGYFNGKLCTVGTYTWKIEFKTSLNEERKIILGSVNVIR